jgi:nitroreductase
MMIEELVLKNRSCRRFRQYETIETETLRELINLARLSPSAANLQPLRYIISCDPAKNELIFPQLGWAGYLHDWDGPVPGERPAAYIIILGDNNVSKNINCDHGIAAQAILLGAVEMGLAGCIIASVKREVIHQMLNIPASYQILLTLALGKPEEKIVLEEVGDDGKIEYWRDAEGIHHVPKRSLDDIILKL